MRFRIISGVTYQILCDKLPFPFPFGKRGEESPTIALYGGIVCLLRDTDFHYHHIISLNDLNIDIDKKSEITWRNTDYKKTYIEFYTNVIKLMTAYQREVTIDGVLRKEIDYRYWVC